MRRYRGWSFRVFVRMFASEGLLVCMVHGTSLRSTEVGGGHLRLKAPAKSIPATAIGPSTAPTGPSWPPPSCPL